MRQPALVYPGVHALHLIGAGVVPAHQLQHGVQRRMRAAAARILLDRDAGLDDIQRIGPRRQAALDVIGARTVEHVQEALLVFEDGRAVRGKALPRQPRRIQAVARAMADVQRLGHRAEIRLDA